MLACAVALIFLVDISSSVDNNEYSLQKKGIVDVLMEEGIQEMLLAQPEPVALTIIEWAEKNPRVIVPWSIVSDKKKIDEFAMNYASSIRPTVTEVGYFTHIGDALNNGISYFDQLPCRAQKKIIDVSGDGIDDGPDPVREEAKTKAVQNEITINGLVIIDESYKRPLYDWYVENLITIDGFVIKSEGFEDFYRAIRRKFITEIAMKGGN